MPDIGYIAGRTERISQSEILLSADLAAVRGPVLDWIASVARQPLPDAMRAGMAHALDCPGEFHVETLNWPAPSPASPGTASATPAGWAARVDDRRADRNVVTKIRLTPATVDGTLLTVRMHATRIAGQPSAPRAIPRFMLDIAARFPSTLDGVASSLTPLPVDSADDVEALIALLLLPGRMNCVVGVSMAADETAAARARIEAERLARPLFGAAHVRLLSRAAAQLLTGRLGRMLSVFNGAVRIWQPGLQPDIANPFDHRLFLAARVAEDGNWVRSAVVEQVLRTSAARRDIEPWPFGTGVAVASLDPTDAAPARSTLAAPTQIGGGEPVSRAVGQTELFALQQALAQQRDEHEQMLALADESLREMAAEREGLLGLVYNLQARNERLHTLIRVQDHARAVDIPGDFENLGDWARTYLGDRVELLPRALRAAKKSEFRDPPLAYRALLLLHDCYVPSRRGEAGAHASWENGLRALGLDLQRSFTGTRAGEFGDAYVVDYDGRRQLLEWHLKGSNSRDPRFGFRLYFFWNEQRHRAVVGSLPAHLENRIS